MIVRKGAQHLIKKFKVSPEASDTGFYIYAGKVLFRPFSILPGFGGDKITFFRATGETDAKT